MKSTLRTFVAVEMDEAIRRAAARWIEEFRTAAADVNWVKPQNMHLTVKFLGDVASDKIPQVCDTVARAVADIQPFELEIRGVGAFPNVKRPRNVWLGVGAGEERLADLAERIDAALKKIGFPREARGFHGHLTLGRIRHPSPGLSTLARLLPSNGTAGVAAGVVAVEEVVVFSSQLSRAGPTYEALSRAPLSGKT
jgi:RNA 2',3'-cyclic 3'-phosphodiesterase